MKELKFDPEVEIIAFPRQDIVTASIGDPDFGHTGGGSFDDDEFGDM